MAERFYKLSRALAARRDLRATDKVVLAVLRDRLGRKAYAWPGIRRIAVDAGMNRETVLVALARLVAVGLLAVDRRGRGRVNHYRLSDLPDESGRKPQPLLPYESGRKPRPVGDPGQTRPTAKSGRKPQPQVAGNPGQNQTDLKKQKKKRGPSVRWDPVAELFIVTPDQLENWTRDFPGVKVLAEIRKAGAWHAANKRWRSAFQTAITRWLTRAAESRQRTPGEKTAAVVRRGVNAMHEYLAEQEESP